MMAEGLSSKLRWDHVLEEEGSKLRTQTGRFLPEIV